MKDDHINVFYSDEDGGYVADILTGPWAGRLNISKKTRSRNGASLGIRDVQGPGSGHRRSAENADPERVA
jgi:hypothetical protein